MAIHRHAPSDLKLFELMNLLFFGDKTLECAIEADGWMFGINLPLPTPRQVDDDESIRIVQVTKQDVILVLPERDGFDRVPKKQMTRWHFPLQFRDQIFRGIGVGRIPSLRQFQIICWF